MQKWEQGWAWLILKQRITPASRGLSRPDSGALSGASARYSLDNAIETEYLGLTGNQALERKKAKFLKHVVALSNSNPNNNSYIIVGIKDGTNDLIGQSLVDDSEIQNLIKTYLEYPPSVAFPKRGRLHF